MSGSFPYSPQFSKAEEKVIQNLKKKKKSPVSRMKFPVSLPWALGGEAEIKEPVFFFMFHLPVL